MPLPSDNVRSRVLWSVPVVGVLGFSWFCQAAGQVTGFSTRYTMWEVLQLVCNNGTPDDWVPRGLPEWICFSFVMSAAVLWLVCLIPWRARRTTLLWSIVAWLIPLWPFWAVLIHNPVWVNLAVLHTGPFEAVSYICQRLDGAFFSNRKYVALVYPAWFWYLGFVTLVVSRRKDPPRNVCAQCGYSLEGLACSTCPECGCDARERPGKKQAREGIVRSPFS